MHSQVQNSKRTQRGQAMFMLTIALLALCGMMGLAVDLGWSFFVKKAAQSAADAAAMAAIREALRYGVPGGFTCGSSDKIYCAPAPVDCGTVIGAAGTYLNLVSGCKYAETNGFTSNGHGNRQVVRIQSNDISTPPPNAPGVNDVRYWVTVTITETVPQMFSAVLGNSNGQVTARATAGAVHVVLPGSFYSINREGDCRGSSHCGINIDLSGNGTLQAPNGLLMSSRCSGKGSLPGCDGEAGMHSGAGAVVNTSSIQIRLTGTADSTTAFPGWTNGTNGENFVDPTAGRTQPPVVASDPVKTCGIDSGLIRQAGSSPVVLGPYNYYAYTGTGANRRPTGAAIQLDGTDIRFSPTGTCPGILSLTGVTQTSDFPAYFFYGGLRAANGSGVTFGSGQYVVVGASAASGSASPILESGGGNATMKTSAGASNMFILTAPTATPYPGLSTQLNIPEIATAVGGLSQGYVNLKAGNSSAFDLQGYQKGSGPAILDDYNGILFWQDRRNSTVKYNADGTYGCGGPDYITGCSKTQSELDNDRVVTGRKQDSRVLNVNATANITAGLDGVLYQPRGAWASFQGNGDFGGGIQIVTGALDIGGGGDIVLNEPSTPFLTFIAALIE